MSHDPNGWMCPKCGTVWSPLVRSCETCVMVNSRQPTQILDNPLYPKTTLPPCSRGQANGYGVPMPPVSNMPPDQTIKMIFIDESENAYQKFERDFHPSFNGKTMYFDGTDNDCVHMRPVASVPPKAQEPQ